MLTIPSLPGSFVPWPSRRTYAVQVSAAEGQGPKVLIDGRKQLLGTRQAQRNMANIEVLHVVRAF